MNTQPSISPTPTGRHAPRMLHTSMAPSPKAKKSSVTACGNRLVGPDIRNGVYIITLSTLTKITNPVMVSPISRQPGVAAGSPTDRIHKGTRPSVLAGAAGGEGGGTGGCGSV